MSSAQLESLPITEIDPLAGLSSAAILRREAAERLAAHRQRRGRHGHHGHYAEGAETGVATGRRPETRNRVAEAVAERYAQSPSYRAVLAAEAEKAIRQAAAAAEVAARSADAVATAQKELLAELDKWTEPVAFTPQTAALVVPEPAPALAGKEAAKEAPPAVVKARPRPQPAVFTPVSTPVKEVSTAGLTVRLYEDLPRPVAPPPAPASPAVAADGPAGVQAAPYAEHDQDEAQALDEEIAFRQSPVFETLEVFDHTTEPIVANLLAFPRQLVAARKARPRLAEGPLREGSPRSPQLRIFEVEPEQATPAQQPVSAVPEWSSIYLDALEPLETRHNAYGEDQLDADTAILPSLLPPHTAPVSLRLMAATVDAVLVLGAFVAFAAVAAHIAGQVPMGAAAGVTAAVMLAVFYLLYELLFFSFTGQTPGMRYARIGLCTFTDENPSRSAMRRRIWAQVVAAVPLGLGLLWVCLDDDRLGWHDRISRMYQRAY